MLVDDKHRPAILLALINNYVDAMTSAADTPTDADAAKQATEYAEAYKALTGEGLNEEWVTRIINNNIEFHREQAAYNRNLRYVGDINEVLS